jgi:hypothetical protein
MGHCGEVSNTRAQFRSLILVDLDIHAFLGGPRVPIWHMDMEAILDVIPSIMEWLISLTIPYPIPYYGPNMVWSLMGYGPRSPGWHGSDWWVGLGWARFQVPDPFC